MSVVVFTGIKSAAQATARLRSRMQRTGKTVERESDAEVTRLAQDMQSRARRLATTRLHKDSGALESAITGYLVRRGDTLSARLRLNARVAPHGAAHETGRTITPKRSGWLTVPLTPEAEDRSARSFGRLVVIRSRRGALLLAAPDAGGGIRPLYVLVRSVRLRGQFFLRDAHREAAAAFPAQAGARIKSSVKAIR
jgi:hypothetical protein